MLPDMKIAQALMESYFGHVHPVFPIIHQEVFEAQHFNLFQLGVSSVSTKWLATYNLILAIGAVLQNIRGGTNLGHGCHHLDFFMRARILGALDGGVLFEIATLQDIQTVTLTGMYLLASHQTNR